MSMILDPEEAEKEAFKQKVVPWTPKVLQGGKNRNWIMDLELGTWFLAKSRNPEMKNDWTMNEYTLIAKDFNTDTFRVITLLPTDQTMKLWGIGAEFSSSNRLVRVLGIIQNGPDGLEHNEEAADISSERSETGEYKV